MNAGEGCMIERGAPSFFDRTEEVLFKQLSQRRMRE